LGKSSLGDEAHSISDLGDETPDPSFTSILGGDNALGGVDISLRSAESKP
jgi:hypothetical protein